MQPAEPAPHVPGRLLDKLGGRHCAVVRLRPLGDGERPSRGTLGSASSRRVASLTASPREQAPRHRQPRPRPRHPRRVLSHVADGRADQQRLPRRKRPRHRPMPAVADHHVRRRHRLRVEQPIDQRRVAGHLDRPLGPVPIRRRQDPHRLIRQPVERHPQQLAIGILRRARRDQNQRPLTVRNLHRFARHLEEERPGHPHVRRPPARVLQLWERPHDRQQLADPAVKSLDRRQPQPPPRLIELVPAPPQPHLEQRPRRPPGHPPEARPRWTQPERVERHPRLLHRIDVRDQRGVWDAGDLGRERRRQRQDVAHHQIRLEPLHQPSQRPGGGRRGLPVGRVRPRRRIHRVLLRAGEAQPLALDRLPPPLPGLDQHLMAAPRQLARERDCRKGMARIAERGDQQPQPSIWAAHCADPRASTPSFDPWPSDATTPSASATR